MQILNINELQSVAGGGFLDKVASDLSQRSKCMGDGRNTEIRCYNNQDVNVQNWSVRPGEWNCAIWFCCEEKGHAQVVMGRKYYDCAKKIEAVLDEPYPADLKNAGATEL